MDGYVSTSKFWEAVQKDFGAVPLKVQCILDYEGYTPSSNVESLTPKSINAIESDMKLVGAYLKLKQVNMENYYGVFKDTPETFVFLLGERSCIEHLCKFFKENGAQKYLKAYQNFKKQQVLGSIENRPLENDHDQSEENIIKSKIIYHYESQIRNINSTSFNEFLMSIRKVTAQVTTGAENGKFSAIVCCPLCNKNIKATKQYGGCWLIGNFIKHCETRHFAMPREVVERKKRLKNQENVLLVQACPPKLVEEEILATITLDRSSLIEEEDTEACFSTSGVINSSLETDILDNSCITMLDESMERVHSAAEIYISTSEHEISNELQSKDETCSLDNSNNNASSTLDEKQDRENSTTYQETTQLEIEMLPLSQAHLKDGTQTFVADINIGYDILKTPSKPCSSPSPSPHKRSNSHFFGSPSTVVRTKDSPALRNRSDPDVSDSVLDQNIHLPGSENSFFALIQSPSREPLSPEGPTSCQEENLPRTPPKKGCFKMELFSGQGDSKTDAVEKKKKKWALSLSHFSSSFKISPDTSMQTELLPVCQMLASPKPKAVKDQENIAPPMRKLKAKKTTPESARRIDTSLRKTPTSANKDNLLLNWTSRLSEPRRRFTDSLNESIPDEDERNDEKTTRESARRIDSSFRETPTSANKDNSLLKRTSRLSEPRRRFTDSLNKSMPDEDETYFSKFVVPSPTLEDPEEDDFGIDKTYFSKAENDINRSEPSARPAVSLPRDKKEPLTQKISLSTLSKAPILAEETQDSGMSSVLFVKLSSQEEVITIDETQPNKNDLITEAIREEHRKEECACLSVLNVMGPVKQNVKQESPFPAKHDLPLLKKPTFSTISYERLCTECNKRYQFLLSQSLALDVICSKLPRSCRGCRLTQLHETPPDFWNPELTTTQD